MKKLLFLCTAVATLFTACNNDCNHDFIEHDYSQELVGTWSIIGADCAYAVVIKADGTMDFTCVDEGKFYEETARYKVVNNRMTIIWDDGTIEEGRLDLVTGCYFSMTIDEETGASYYFAYCDKELSDKMVGSWLVQSDMTSEIHTYYADGTTDCLAYYYHLGEQYETFVTGTYKVVGDLLFETVEYGEGMVYSYASRISYTPNGSPFGDVMTSKTYSLNEEGNDLLESVGTVVRVKPTLDLAGKKYDYKDTYVTNVKGKDKDVSFMGYTVNFAKMDGSELDKLLSALLFNVEFSDANTLCYTYQHNNSKETFDAPIVVEGNKVTIKMSAKKSTLKDVVLYTFQNVDCTRMHLCMDKCAFVNFHANMQAMLMEATDEQFDINNADSVNAIYDNINSAVETIKVNIVMKATK